MAFLSTVRKDKVTGKTRSFTHIRKFYDAILFGSREQGTSLPSEPIDFHQAIENYLKSFKKENIAANKRGEVDETAADPMPFALYVALCTWSVESGDIFSWCYMIILWNCMGRSASVDPLGLHNFKLGTRTDSIVITYDDSKMDSTGERVHPKNCYANPYCPSTSMFLALGIYCMLYPEQYESTDCLFLKERTIIGTATKRFTARLRTLVSNHCEEIKTWAVPERIKGHSSRKGTATYLTAATLNPPPLPSIAHRGEWSQGKVQDIYFNFAQPGDHYVGRMLAGLNPTSPSFKVLPPHFTCGLDNKYVKEGIELCYGRILRTRQNLDYLPGMFLLLLASVVYHEQWIRKFILDKKKHPFSNLFLLEDVNLIQNIKSLVTTEPTKNMPQPTGIPTPNTHRSTKYNGRNFT